MKRADLEYYLNKCSTPSDFATFAKKMEHLLDVKNIIVLNTVMAKLL